MAGQETSDASEHCGRTLGAEQQGAAKNSGASWPIGGAFVPMHRQYVEYMRGVDVTDQLRGNYSSQLRCHKWWVKIFHFIVDQTMVNSYVTWVKQMEDLGLPTTSHLAFKIAVGKHLAAEAILARRRGRHPPEPRQRGPPTVQTLFRSSRKRQCVICGGVQKWFCMACGDKWMCQESCYQAHHEIIYAMG